MSWDAEDFIRLEKLTPVVLVDPFGPGSKIVVKMYENESRKEIMIYLEKWNLENIFSTNVDRK